MTLIPSHPHTPFNRRFVLPLAHTNTHREVRCTIPTMSQSEKLRSKHIRTLEALADLTRENTSLQQQVAELQQAFDLRNARDQELSMDTSSIKVEQLTQQLERLDFDNQQLSKQSEQSVAAIAELKKEHALALAAMRKSVLSSSREASEAQTESMALQQENENMRAEFMDLRAKSTKAWELEVSNRSHVLEIEKLKEEIDRLKFEDQQQRVEYVKNLKQTETEATAVLELEKQHTLVALAAKDSEWQQTVDDLKRCVQQEQARVLELEQLLQQSIQRYDNKVAAASPPRAPTSPKIDTNVLKERIRTLEKAVQEGVHTIEELRKQLAEKENQTTKEEETGGKGFGAFIDIKRENQVLRAQIKDLMTTQARILGGSSGGRRVQPGARRRR